jgi:hypothetical protein
MDQPVNVNQETLTLSVSKMLGADVASTTYQVKELQGGTIGNVSLLWGEAEIRGGEILPFKIVLKVSGKWERYNDPQSWRREYDLYTSDLEKRFLPSMRWPKCYHAEITGDEIRLWLEYIDGISGLDLTVDMYERAALELGRFQGKLYAEKPAALQSITNLSHANYQKEYYEYYRSWDVVYDYVRSANCELPKHICGMIIDNDENADETWGLIAATLPVVLCHKDFWVTNILYTNGENPEILLIDWDTAGWGYFGEDMASLIADEADVENMVEIYNRCVPAYYRGFGEYADVSHIKEHFTKELILFMFGYRLVEWYLNADEPEEKKLHLDTLQRVYEMK